MTNLVERLKRACVDGDLDLCGEAAAEIERLRQLIDKTGTEWLAIEGVPFDGAIDGAMKAAVAEIERLREALQEIVDDYDYVKKNATLIEFLQINKSLVYYEIAKKALNQCTNTSV